MNFKEYYSHLYKNASRVLEVMPNKEAFPLSTHFIDYSSYGTKNSIALNINTDTFPFKDDYFDFVYCNRGFEGLYNPVNAFNEMKRVGQAMYIETTSPVAEMMRDIDIHKAKNAQFQISSFRGYIQHLYFVWNTENVLYFLPKLPIIEFISRNENVWQTFISREPLTKRTYYYMEDSNIAQCKMLIHDVDYNIVTEYNDKINAALSQSLNNTNSIIHKQMQLTNINNTSIDSMDILTDALTRISKIEGFTCEIGIEHGISTKLILNNLKDSSKIHISLDPLGNTDSQKQKILSELYTYCFENNIQYLFFPLEITDFFTKYKDGLSIYIEGNKKTINKYSLVFFHTIKPTKEILNLFKNRISIGGIIIFNKNIFSNDLDKYLKKIGFTILQKNNYNLSYMKKTLELPKVTESREIISKETSKISKFSKSVKDLINDPMTESLDNLLNELIMPS